MQALIKGNTYCFPVLAVKNNRRTFGHNPIRFVNDITFTTPEGPITCEYCSLDDKQDYFVENKKGCFEVVFVKDSVKLTYEIKPTGSPADWEDIPVTNISGPQARGPVPVNLNSIALSYAKDCMVASINTHGRRIDDDFKQELFALADSMAEYLKGKQS